MAQTFTTTIFQAEDMNATGILVPPEVVAAFGTKKRFPVTVTLNGYTYRSTVVVYNGNFMLPLAREHREAAGIRGGDTVAVTLELDTEPRVVEVPEDLAAALAAVPGAREAFDTLAYTHRKEYVRSIEEAKAPETRARRIASTVAKMSGT